MDDEAICLDCGWSGPPSELIVAKGMPDKCPECDSTNLAVDDYEPDEDDINLDMFGGYDE